MWGRLTAKEQRARHVLLSLILTESRDPGVQALASRLEVPESEAAKLLSGLERKGFLVRDQRSNKIKAAYPLSTRPTHHRVALKDGGQQGYALCAIDALGLGPLFGAAVIANANCPHCGRSIRLRVQENQIVAVRPAGVVVWYSLPELLTKSEPNLNLAEAHWPRTNFFCTEEEAWKWAKSHRATRGTVMSLTQAMARACEVFGSVEWSKTAKSSETLGAGAARDRWDHLNLRGLLHPVCGRSPRGDRAGGVGRASRLHPFPTLGPVCRAAGDWTRPPQVRCWEAERRELMAKEIVVYSQPGWAGCHQEKEFLSQKGVAFVDKNIREDPAALDELQRLGYKATPVTVIDGEVIVGFDRGKLMRLLGLSWKATVVRSGGGDGQGSV